jgi:ATP/maltotriose-dependent transcriptional regulator MalT
VRDDLLERARAAYAACRWEEAYGDFTSVLPRAELSTEDLAAQADAAWWLGRTDESLDLCEEVYRRHVDADEPLAARLAVETGFLWLIRGEETIASGWFARAQRLLGNGPERAEHGYLQHLSVLERLEAGQFEDAASLARQICELGRRHDDPTLCALAQVLEGVAAARNGDLDDGLAAIDEAMLAVRSGAVARSWAGNLYCQLMSLFLELADFPRARAWTEATERWCRQHNHAAMFAGVCRVHRAQLLHLEGALQDAERSAAQACRDLADMNADAVAAAHYELGELSRRRGDLAGAERSYLHAHELGRDPQPGLALVHLAQGRDTAALNAVEAALTSTDQPLRRVPLLAAQTTIADHLGDAGRAARAAEELVGIAERFASPGLVAAARQAAGTARLLAGEPHRALPLLREAQRRWRDLDVRCEAATVQLAVARALDAVGDTDSAQRERSSATDVLTRLGVAIPQYLRGRADVAGLTPREREVLALVATGATNAGIAGRLVLSERTVERHLSNLFRKLGVSSRTEAARYAFVHGLAPSED